MSNNNKVALVTGGNRGIGYELVKQLAQRWVSSDMGGPSAPRTPREAAESILWLAAIGPEGAHGGFFRDGKRIEW